MNTSLSALLSGKTVGVFFGGQSPEHDISIITGSFILSELKKNGVDALPLYICPKGNWYSHPSLAELKFFKEDFLPKLESLPVYDLHLAESKKKMILRKKSLLGERSIAIDFVFPAFHGTKGEDGTFQGLCEFLSVPYAGCGVFSSALTINKAITKEMFLHEGINTTKFLSCTESAYRNNPSEIITAIHEDLTYPIFVKPAKAGSSIGITRVKTEDNLEDALEVAFSFDDEVVIENGVQNVIDLTCAVLSDGEQTWASEIQESLFEDGFLSYDDKYMKDGGTQTGGATQSLIIPANITDEQKQEIQTQAQQIFEAIRANGTARVDFLMDSETGELFANEINTLPGTLYHHLWEKSGKDITEVLESMVKNGLCRDGMEDKTDIRFQSGVLNDANSMKLQYQG